MRGKAALLVGIGFVQLLGSGTPALAQATGVDALLEQGRYWSERGRQDRAREAYRRVLELDPGNRKARQALARPAPSPAPPVQAQPRRAVTAKPSAPLSLGSSARTGGATPAASRPAAAKPAAADYRAAGFQYLDQENLEGAARQFQAALSRSPSDAETLGGLGIVRLRQERFGEARDLLERATTLGNASQWSPALEAARFYAGMKEALGALRSGNLAQAEGLAEELVGSSFEDSSSAFLLLADVYEKQGRFADAAKVLEHASGMRSQERDRLRSRAARNRALQAAQFGDDNRTEQEFVAGLMLDERDPWIRYEFGRYLADRGRIAEADSMVASLSAIGSADAFYAAALLSHQRGDLRQSQAFIDRIPDDERDDLITSFAQGLVVDREIEWARELSAQGRAPQAVARLQELREGAALPAAKSAALANALLELGDEQNAVAAARSALSSGLADLQAYEPVVRVLAKAGMQAEARMALQTAREQASSSKQDQALVDRLSAVLAVTQAGALREGGQYAAAFDLLQSAWMSAPESADILFELAQLYQAGSLPAKSAQTYQLFLQKEPDNKGALLGLARTAAAAKDHDLAGNAFGRAVRAAPEDYEVYLAGADIEKARGREGRALRYLEKARELYARQTASGAGAFSAKNPFATGLADANPFRPAVSRAEAVNPFALGADTRLPQRVSASADAFASPASRSGLVELDPVGRRAPGLPGAAEGAAFQAGQPDSTLVRIQQDIASLSGRRGPQAEISTGYRQRSGENGLSALDEVSAKAEISTHVGAGRIGLRAEAVVLDAGTPDRSALARLGRNATREAQAIVDEAPAELAPAGIQHASGVAPSITYRSDLVDAEIGSTPLGFDKKDVTFRVEAHPSSPVGLNSRAWFERKPVTDSVLSYAGMRDPESGAYWGQVMKVGGGVAVSYDEGGTGIYGDASFHRYSGENVNRNSGFALNAGAYFLLHEQGRSRLTAGANINYQDFANNQNFFTFGHGGYFSPQMFLAAAFPIRYAFMGDKLELEIEGTPGFQSFEQDAAALYPTDAAAQAGLDFLKLSNTDVRTGYDAISKTGLAFSGRARASYDVGPQTSLIWSADVNTFGRYDELKSWIGIKQTFGSEDGRMAGASSSNLQCASLNC
ncbi:cellulose synthase subunit BcsC-related outer membrane protein [Altericroceibacterium xinjiangense]|uniref:cellulose synthase subunit BcsC-related outer membrane protein n=1 Tax=Altericroceibacterium xinjiangense TaxID=762261 RepID=UPI000F7E2EA8|nr:cellulose synthase subunit BcsC-related outer membrane protein [Altericroceibacterium xinjiangense]